MNRLSILLIVLLLVLCFGSVPALAFDPEPEGVDSESNTEVVEIEEGVYQVYDEQSDYESGDGDESVVYESGAGSDNGEVDYSGSEPEYSSEEGNNNSDAGTTEAVESTDGQNQDDRIDSLIAKVEELHNDFLKLLISIWVLAGLYLGTKLIKGLFGYYG